MTGQLALVWRRARCFLRVITGPARQRRDPVIHLGALPGARRGKLDARVTLVLAIRRRRIALPAHDGGGDGWALSGPFRFAMTSEVIDPGRSICDHPFHGALSSQRR
ncbi:MAG: hypothetical protein AB1586_00725 [Pseudomonadota bacterium]